MFLYSLVLFRILPDSLLFSEISLHSLVFFFEIFEILWDYLESSPIFFRFSLIPKFSGFSRIFSAFMRCFRNFFFSDSLKFSRILSNPLRLFPDSQGFFRVFLDSPKPSLTCSEFPDILSYFSGVSQIVTDFCIFSYSFGFFSD